MSIISEYKLKDMKLKNRLVLPPMCMYSSEKGYVNEFYKAHYGSFALGQVGLIIIEATGVTENGRITDDDLGIWNEKFVDGLKNLVDFSHKYGSACGIQLAHAGRKSRVKNLEHYAPSKIDFKDTYNIPKEMSLKEIEYVVSSFGKSAKYANLAGMDIIEIHAAHGYLIHQFLSPITNKRKDNYGGELKNRILFLKMILEEVKKYWPKNKPISLRVSASDYIEDGIDIHMMVKIINEIKEYIDIVHVSSGGLIETDIDVYPGYQVEFSNIIKKECDIPTIAVGLLEDYNLSEYILKNEKCDLVAVGRGLLRNPKLLMEYVDKNKLKYNCLTQYERAY
ncbi:NADPH dehydrogenase NamA [Miniphocaeibacter massiliensis]|uniref:NADPH dehydrogenase NamA n=1 Tax=Miniphocaeibacter massiliensis TaxID=2041841 RepID=UPI000C1C3F51|nr:NADPH dehydrogenase NamA [Miniphocaeibacter massiliensis]